MATAGWAEARAVPLAGDASARRYLRLALAGATAVLMDAPPGQADSAEDFARIAGHLRGIGLSAPAVLAADTAQGFLLLEDLGDALFARLADADPVQEAALYPLAVDVLAHLQARPAPNGLPDLSAQDWAEAASLALTAYAPVAGTAPDPAPFCDALATALTRHADGPRVLILRDYHAENLLWLPNRDGLARVGLLDFQLAQMGQPAYDLVSLLQDARRDVAPEVEAAMCRRFAETTGVADPGAAYAVLGAQRGLRIMGIFARLATEAGKTQYLHLLPRVWRQVQRNLAHPALSPLAALCETALPPPTPAVLERIARACRP